MMDIVRIVVRAAAVIPLRDKAEEEDNGAA